MIRPSLQRSLIAFALIFASGFLGYFLPRMGGRLPLMLLPSGLAVAAMCRWGIRQWPAVFLAGFAIELSVHTPYIAAFGVGAGLAAAAALSCWILEWGDFDHDFRRAGDVPLFVLSAAIGMVLAPGIARLGFLLAGMPGGQPTPPAHWIRWWGNVAAGVLLIAPGLIAANSTSLQRLRERWGESILWFCGVLMCCAAIVWLPGSLGRPIIALAALILMVVGTIHFGLVIAAFGAFLISALTAYSFEFNDGAFGGLQELQGLVITWSFVAALNFVCLSITALLAERDSAALAKLQAEHRYAEIFDGSPQPVWVHDRRTLRFLMINEAALRQYGWSREELLSMSVGALTPPGEPQWTDDQVKAGISAEPTETRHLTKDGRVLDVEVWSRSIDFADRPAELVFAVDVTGRRAFGRALLDAIAGEQLRIGQEMHDGLGQELTGLALSVRALANRAAREREAIAEDLDQLASLATNCIQDARLIVQGLTPLTDADGNLETALEGLAQRSALSGTDVRVHATRGVPIHIDLKARNHLYRIAQEAVQNALKHSGASMIRIELQTREDSIRLEILDNGRGILPENPVTGGLGMRTMRFRASAIGGKLTLSRREGEGNSVLCEMAQPRARPEGERTEYGRAAG